MKRRTLLKASFAAAAMVNAGLLIPGRVMAAYPKAAFESTDEVTALTAAFGSSEYTESRDILIIVPFIAENEIEVPIQITSSIADTESISIVVSSNPTPLAASFNFFGAAPFVSTRIKVAETSEVLAVVKAGGSLYVAREEVKIGVGNCGISSS